MSATAVLYGIKAAGGLAQGYFGYTQMQEAARREEALRAQGMPQMQTPQEYFDLYQRPTETSLDSNRLWASWLQLSSVQRNSTSKSTQTNMLVTC
jgi:hypothetical protein